MTGKPGALTNEQRGEREVKIREMLDKGMSLNEMARELAIAPQSVHAFMKRRGWKTNA